jgi:hypothetical protein
VGEAVPSGVAATFARFPQLSPRATREACGCGATAWLRDSDREFGIGDGGSLSKHVNRDRNAEFLGLCRFCRIGKCRGCTAPSSDNSSMIFFRPNGNVDFAVNLFQLVHGSVDYFITLVPTNFEFLCQ